MIKEVIMYIPTLFPAAVPSWLYVIIVTIGTIFLPIQPLIYVMVILIFVDNITGIGADARSKGIKICLFNMKMWSNINSHKLGKSITKTLAYMLLVVTVFLVDTYMVSILEENYLTHMIVVAIAFREIVSILENVEMITGKGIITTIIGFIRNGFKKTFADQLSKEHEKNKK